MALRKKSQTFVLENLPGDGLEQIVPGTTFESLEHGRSGRICRHHDHWNGSGLLPKSVQHRQAIHNRHFEVKQNPIDGFCPEYLEPFHGV